MPVIGEIDAALFGVVAGGVVAALGYVGRLLIETWRAGQKAKALRITRLFQLQALLLASRTAFKVQRDLADRLAERIGAQQGAVLPAGSGLERRFAQLHATFDAESIDLHSVIRGYTQHALKPLNSAMLDWLRADTDYRTAPGESGAEVTLASRLNQLELHILLWLAKYEVWIPDRLDHALVYLDDEEEHGLRFPPGLDEAVDAVINLAGRSNGAQLIN
jgi:hypothetical protein